MGLTASSKPLLWLVALGVFMQMLDSTIVNTALPTMALGLNEDPLRMQSVVVSYALTMATLIPASGWLADRFGTRNVFLWALVLFTLGSVLCASASGLRQLDAARVVQGIGGAMLLPIGRLVVMRVVPRAEFLKAMAFVSLPALIGPLIGPALGGWLVQAASWRWIFLINLPVGAIAVVFAWRYMPNLRGPRTRFDLLGYVLVSFSMVAISVSLDVLASRGAFHLDAVVLFALGIAGLAGYWMHAVRTPDALFPRSLFRVPAFHIGILGNLFARIGTRSMPFLIPLLLQLCLGYSPMQAGLMMVPVALAAMASKRMVVALVRHLGYRRVLIGNTVLVGLSMASFALISPAQPEWLQVLQLAFFGMVNSLQFTAMNTVTLRDLDSDHASSGNSLLSMVMMLSMSLGVATASALLAGFTNVVGSGSEPDALTAFHATFVCMGLVTTASAWVFWRLDPERGAAPDPGSMRGG